MPALELPNPPTPIQPPVMVACPACKGRGTRNWSFHVPVPCFACNGLGRVSVIRAAVIKRGR